MQRRHALVAGVVLLALAAAGPSRGAQEPTAPAHAATATAACGDCHEQAAKFTTNVHAHRKGVEGEAACASCHGDGTKHVESGGDKSLIRVVRGASGAEVCLTCHVKVDAHASYRNGINMRGEAVTCLSCHSIHASDPKQRALLSRPVDTLCGSCHVSQAAAFQKPFAHRLRGGMSCVSCHDPHGLARAGALRPTRGGELPCLSCHAEKRGPFVFSHVNGVAGDCLSCHESHGSSNPKRLTRANVYQLCLECHSPITPGVLGSQPPSFHDLRVPRYRNCTTCHTAVHGSNRSPALLK
jgi:DmsE family decaheme c-type cytochrome